MFRSWSHSWDSSHLLGLLRQPEVRNTIYEQLDLEHVFHAVHDEIVELRNAYLQQKLELLHLKQEVDLLKCVYFNHLLLNYDDKFRDSDVMDLGLSLPHDTCDGDTCNCFFRLFAETPLHAAALRDQYQFVSLLLRNGANPNLIDSSGATPLDLAKKNRSEECVKIIQQEMGSNHAVSKPRRPKSVRSNQLDSAAAQQFDPRRAMRAGHSENRMQQQKQEEQIFHRACLNSSVAEAQKAGANLTPVAKRQVINHVPEGGASLLYKICEKGNLGMAAYLIKLGAEGLVNPVTVQSPLHAACHHGHNRLIQLLLEHFPELAQAPNLDGALPLHTASANGHTEIVKDLLYYNYPEEFKQIYRENNGNRLFRLGVPINARDGRGHSPLHLACRNDYVEIAKLLVTYSVPVWKRDPLFTNNEEPEGKAKPVVENVTPRERELESPDAREATEDLYVNSKAFRKSETKEEIRPIEIDNLDLDGCSALHLAVKGAGNHGYHEIGEVLLEYGANPNKPIISPSGNTTALMEACRRDDYLMVDLLLRHKAHDTDQKVLHFAINMQQNEIIALLLRSRAFINSEHKINKKALLHEVFGEATGMTDTYDVSATPFPASSVIINWHNLGLKMVTYECLLQAALIHNSNIPPAKSDLSLYAITRIDISKNNIEFLPKELFLLKSLRLLNVSENKLLWLPGCACNLIIPSSFSEDGASEDLGQVLGSPKRSPLDSTYYWQSPLLEEVQLQKNQLSELPASLFQLPSLQRLNASHNELTILPYEMWTSGSLVELNLSHNKLHKLPVMPESPSGLVNNLPGYNSLVDSTETLNIEETSSVHSTPQRKPSSQDSASPCTPCNSSGSSNPDFMSMHTTKPYTDMSVVHSNSWSSKLRVHSMSMDSDVEGGRSKRCMLSELNLSYNEFDAVPTGLACLVPQLTKLILTGNKLMQVGPLSAFPALLKYLDLSRNLISQQYSLDSGRVSSSEDVFTDKAHCYSPVPVKTHRSKSQPVPSRTRTSSSTSSSSIASSSGSSPFFHASNCMHRMHSQLEQLRTLRLDHNRLSHLQIGIETKVTPSKLDENKSGTDQQQRGQAKTTSTHLFYPNLTMLDVTKNNLTFVPPEVSLMSQLTELKIASNQMKELPAEIGLLRKLWNLDYSNNPVERSMQALLGEKARKTAAVLGYLKSIKEEATLYNRMKLMFVGVQGIGKTSLLQKLQKEGSGPIYRKKNWAQRMGHQLQDVDQKGENISTVGVDIGDLVLQRNTTVIFRTWDFGGQREYYATHQYFLSKRSVYLVVWKVTDGEKGVNDILQWLVNIQARAPNSPVIIVGTHVDQVRKKEYPPNFLPDLQKLIEDKYMSHCEPDKWGLPRVRHHIEVSCKPKLMTRDHIGDLINMIVGVASEEQLPGSKGVRLLEQKIPATYVQLQDVVGLLAKERTLEGKDPVLHTEQYRALVMNKMQEMYNVSFRDLAELSQATQFLHENGILLHYEDVNLQDIYFLDPQWLCDVLANVVTIREINSLAKCGIMHSSALQLLFRNAAFRPDDIKAYIIDLLNKFEVALLWDNDNLLIPSLLPTEEEMSKNIHLLEHVRIPVKGCKSLQHHRRTMLNGMPVADISDNGRMPGVHVVSSFVSYIHGAAMPEQGNDSESQASDDGKDVNTIAEDADISEKENDGESEDVIASADSTASTKSKDEKIRITSTMNPAVTLNRLYLMSYFPSGFWPRLITRLLGDGKILELVEKLYQEMGGETSWFQKKPGCPEWRCWQTGMLLEHHNVHILRIKEASVMDHNNFCNYQQCRLVIRPDTNINWQPLNLECTSILEILVHNQTVTVEVPSSDGTGTASRMITIQPSPEVTASLMAKIVDHIDTLLEDWYPDLGARFIQNSQGMYLITRVVPCIRCLLQQIELQKAVKSGPDAWSMVDVSPTDSLARITQPVYINQKSQPALQPNSVDFMDGDPISTSAPTEPQLPSSGPSSLVNRVTQHGRTVIETVESMYNKTAEATGILPKFDRCGWIWGGGSSDASSGGGGEESDLIYCYLIEQCLHAAQVNRVVFCPRHGNMGPIFVASHDGLVQSAHVAPDAVFQDIGSQYLIEPDQITRGRFLGKGSFGAVFAASMTDKQTGEQVKVALKMLQPIHPGTDATPSMLHQYQVERQRWDKEPMKNSCEAYLNARKELGILLSLHHPNIVPLVGISLQPLSLVLSLAPQGALNDRLKEYRRAGATLSHHVIQQIIVQVSSALVYLHSCQIIYRDLKSENVLVWQLPAPHSDEIVQAVDVKLADYGVSRAVMPSGTKGFAGTPPFIAPEIIQHNGEEAYTEKVDIFSFGMFIYELLVLKLPFEDNDGGAIVSNLKGHILAGGRPAITHKELTFPTYILDLMTTCWNPDPSERPTAKQIMRVAKQPSFSHLQDAVEIEHSTPDVRYHFLCAATLPSQHQDGNTTEFLSTISDEAEDDDVWVAIKYENQGVTQCYLTIFTYQDLRCVSHAKRMSLDADLTPCCLCVANHHMWCAYTEGVIQIYSLLDYSEVLQFRVTSRPEVQIQTMVFSEAEHRVYVVLHTGRLVICDAQIPINLSSSYCPVKTECPGNNRPIFSMALFARLEEMSSELWCGQGQGRISVWNLHNTKGYMKSLQHESKEDVCLLTSQLVEDWSVWSVLRNGKKVYQWNANERRISGSLDISLVLEDAAIDPSCYITSICVHHGHMYIGSSRGDMMVAACNIMTILSVIPCHGNQSPSIKTILPLAIAQEDIANQNEDYISPKTGVLSIGCGYVNSYQETLNPKRIIDRDHVSLFMLSWHGEHWTKPRTPTSE